MSRRLSQKRLDFNSEVKKPFSGKVFYLDLNGHPRHNYVVQNLQALGATVSEFLSREENINYIITTERRKESSRADGLKSSASLRSPFSITTQSGDSPSPNSYEAGNVTAPSAYTRGAEMLQKAARGWGASKKVVFDIETKAHDWQIKIITLEQILADFERHRHLLELSQPTQYTHLVTNRKPPGRGSSHQVHKLAAPFIKVEDKSRLYRPLYCEMTCWPQPDFNSELGTCPFESPPRGIVPIQESSRIRVKPLLPSGNRLSRVAPSKQSSQKQSSVKKLPTTSQPGRSVAGGWKRKGHCECCGMKFDCLNTHLESAQHRMFAREDANYRHLDELISQLSLDLGTLLKSRRSQSDTAVTSEEKTASSSESYSTAVDSCAAVSKHSHVKRKALVTVQDGLPCEVSLSQPGDEQEGCRPKESPASDCKLSDKAVKQQEEERRSASPCPNASAPSTKDVLAFLPVTKRANPSPANSPLRKSPQQQASVVADGHELDKSQKREWYICADSSPQNIQSSQTQNKSPRHCSGQVSVIYVSTHGTVKTVSEMAECCSVTTPQVNQDEEKVCDRHGNPCENALSSAGSSQQSLQRRGWFSHRKSPTASTKQRLKLQRNFSPHADSKSKSTTSASAASAMENDFIVLPHDAAQTPDGSHEGRLLLAEGQKPSSPKSPKTPTRSSRSSCSRTPPSLAPGGQFPRSSRASSVQSPQHRMPVRKVHKSAPPSPLQLHSSANTASGAKLASQPSHESIESVNLIATTDVMMDSAAVFPVTPRTGRTLNRLRSPSTTPQSKADRNVCTAMTPTLAACVKKRSTPSTPKGASVKKNTAQEWTPSRQIPCKARKCSISNQEKSVVIIDKDVAESVAPINVEAWVQNPAVPGMRLFPQTVTPTKRRLHMHDLISVDEDENSSAEAFSSPFPFSKEKLNRVLTHLPLTPTNQQTPTKQRQQTGGATMPVNRKLQLGKDAPVLPLCSPLSSAKVTDCGSMDDFDHTPRRKQRTALVEEMMSDEEPILSVSGNCNRKKCRSLDSSKENNGDTEGNLLGVPAAKRRKQVALPSSSNIEVSRQSPSVIVVQDSDSVSSVASPTNDCIKQQDSAQPRNLSQSTKRRPSSHSRRKRTRTTPVQCTAVSRLESSTVAPFARLEKESLVSSKQPAAVFDFVDESYLSQQETDEFGMVDSYYY